MAKIIIVQKENSDMRYNENTAQQSKVQATLTQLNTVGELRFSGRVGSSSSTSYTRCVTLVANPMK
jgi:hypothetical protein